MKNKQVVAFDLDGTLAISKSAVSNEMAGALSKLLENFEILVISGGEWDQFDKQLLANMLTAQNNFHKLHMMPTCGTVYKVYENGEWVTVYEELLLEDERQHIAKTLEESAKSLGYWEEETWGDIIEDRRSQITYSALGQQAPPEEKYKWDPDHKKKFTLRDHAAKKLEGYDVKVGGKTSIDVTKPGIDKSYGVNKFMEKHDYEMDHIVFLGDMLHEGGNDYPVKAMGVESIAVRDPDHTLEIISEWFD